MTRCAKSLVLLLAFGVLHGQSVRDDIVELEKRVLWEAVKAKKMTLLKERIADDYMEVSDNGVFTKADVLEAVPEIQFIDYSLTDFRTVVLNKDAVIVTYKVEQHWTYKGQKGPVHVRVKRLGAPRRQVVRRVSPGNHRRGEVTNCVYLCLSAFICG